jgi:hypothetical protein
MPQRAIDHTRDEDDWEGNNAAVTCPACRKVFIVSELIHHGKRACPKCGKSVVTVQGGRKTGGTALIDW